MNRIQAEVRGNSKLSAHHVLRGRAITGRARANTPLAGPHFPIHIRALDGQLMPEDRADVRGKLERRLRKFAEAIERISLRCEDVNGPRGGADCVCRIKVVLRGLPSVVFEQRDVSLNAAIDLALDGVERAVRRTLQRRRMKPLRQRT
jgi:ribosome-associated translation inhibitor RaiA